MIHAPKVEVFDVDAMTNVDPKGIVREVERYEVRPFGLYMARPTPGRAQFSYLESWLLPELDLRITDFHFTEGHERDQDFYLDVVHIHRARDTWRTTDLYLDMAVRTGKRAEVIDVDEVLQAVSAGHLDEPTAQHALETGFRTVDALAAHGYRLDEWLAEHHIHLHWKRHT